MTIQMGTFRGIPVFRISYDAWRNVDTCDEEKIYVVEDNVYYHDTEIAKINSRGELTDFDEESFELLRKRWQRKRINEYIGEIIGKEVDAEVAHKVEEKPVKETVKTPDRIVDEFMATWCDNIDNEIAMLKNAVAQMEVK